PMDHTDHTVFEINLNDLEHNLQYLRSKIPGNTLFMGVVKAFAYGNNPVRIAQKLAALEVDYLAVAYASEGIAIRKAGIQKPILVFHPQPSNFKDLIDFHLIPTIYSPLTLTAFIQIAEDRAQTDYPVHLNFNTGMNRLGFSPDKVPDILKKLKQTRAVKVEGVYSHFAASEDDGERDFGLRQLKVFKETSARLIENLDYRPLLHICNTSGILNFPEAHFDMVRSGIGLYGYGNSVQEDKHLRPIGTLKTTILQIHDVKKGESVGYNREFIARRASRTATLPFGHADGLTRIYGHGKVNVLVGGKPAPIIGNVCMDMIMI